MNAHDIIKLINTLTNALTDAVALAEVAKPLFDGSDQAALQAAIQRARSGTDAAIADALAQS